MSNITYNDYYEDQTTAGDNDNNTVAYTDSHYHHRVLVEVPKHWKKEILEAYIHLVNHKTRTGWVISMVIFGSVMIVDPNIEKRTMKDFVPLLKWRASDEDKKKIDEFFKEHGIE